MINGKRKRKERNGRVYLGAWIEKSVLDDAKEKAKEEKRTLAVYVEIALSKYNDR